MTDISHSLNNPNPIPVPVPLLGGAAPVPLLGGVRGGLAKYAFSMALGIGSAITFSGNCALAQVTSDGTLGTQVDPNLAITGGTTVGGTNLFHSFSSFSVPDGAVADFQNATSIVNIFSRVTGGVQSDILGTIQAQGNANLFLLNPSGISFGPNAQLRIGGSFVGTTADGIRFPGGGEFSLTSAVAPNNQLLTVNPSALFFNQTPAGTITNQSTVGLDVGTGQNLFLVGGNVNFDGGVVRAPGGRIELGGLSAPGEVEIVDNLDGSNPSLSFPGVRLSFPDDVARADVLIDNGAIVDVVANDGGDIIINAGNITVSSGNNVCAGIGTPSTAAWNHSGNPDPDPDPNVLVSTGIGLRLRLGDRLSARFDWGLPLVDVPSGDRTLQEEGLYFSLIYRVY